MVGDKSEERYKCDGCPYVTSVKSHLTRHKKCHGNLSKKLVCPHPPCDFRAGNQSNLNSHARLHEVDEDRETPSSSGVKTARTRPQKSNFVFQLLARAKSKVKMKLKDRSNVRVTHTYRNSKGQFAVKNPQKTFKHYSRYRCSVCGFKTNRMDNFKRHSALHDPNRRTFPCPTCCKAFSRRDGVFKHMKRSCHPNPPTLAVQKLSLSPQIETNSGYEVPGRFVIDETGPEDEVAEGEDEDAADDDAEGEDAEDQDPEDGDAEDEVVPALVVVAELLERDPEMPKINDICYRTDTEEEELKENLEQLVGEPTTDLKESDDCTRCGLSAKLPQYLRKHMSPCPVCPGKT